MASCAPRLARIPARRRRRRSLGAERVLVALLPENETIAAAFQNAGGVPVSRRDGPTRADSAFH